MILFVENIHGSSITFLEKFHCMIDDTNCSVMCELNNLKKTIQFLAFLVLFMAFFSQNFIHKTIFQAYAGIQPQVMFQ